ncbi:hypothetical protein O1611_g7727 [Lasiodiplodia mahajangana]|uniref:Uncharacterized protein n=1 Tax=Lasiodiplodia mahajangana TaxID=1108764 RepID=A0ACC2JES6_9PEZI|nr:hypothetical protein O1611_g7727 [Lasiodiplodia mahajangana]
MKYAGANDVTGLRTLFENRMASVTDRTAAGWTPLHIAAASGHTDSYKYMLAHDAHVTSMGRAGLTPAHLAAMYGHLDVLKALFEFDADPEYRNQHGFNIVFEVLHSPFIEHPADNRQMDSGAALVRHRCQWARLSRKLDPRLVRTAPHRWCRAGTRPWRRGQRKVF